MDLQHLTPSREHDAPIYLQLYRRYREAIASGRLNPGDRVPSVRSLASELNLARGTVEVAYQMLVSEGYFMTRGTSGTVVSPHLGNLLEPDHSARSALEVSPAPHLTLRSSEALPFQLGLPALDAFPRKAWVRLTGRRLRTLETVAMTYPDAAGYEPLRRAIATYLGISRGIACSHEQVFVTAGYRGSLELICRALLQPGDLGWYEEPGYLLARHFLEHAGMRLEPVPVDEQGLNVAQGQQQAIDARFAVVTPTHQSPTGVALSLPRRLALLDWASRRQAWIIEDDYDSEFRYHGRPLPALKSLDRDGRVLYNGTFSKVLFPGLRLAYLVVPQAQVDRFRIAAAQYSSAGSNMTQAMVADFMEQGHFTRHLRKMRPVYAERRQHLVEALAQVMGERLQVQPQVGGIQVLTHLTTRHNDKTLAAAAWTQGLAVHALSNWRIQPSDQGGLLMGFANFKTKEEALTSVRALDALMAETGER
ncbi:PLP-dependent aminotransferase family protein [Pseudomonas sp. GD03944]|uniref:MocR-like pyridoxine biosynthesis transcription factor PdxR n=1 Tax=Pseudomonas sp. GD03944 TaxID=2975409 RepID=UPI00244CD823|nr:PLP-dependent aminotransferase family protein [Pseudomonas sp. GD03944]MDH1262066.1 PLP-dependent aminotransferase family protein [Pseudomonas sp. GD03944]